MPERNGKINDGGGCGGGCGGVCVWGGWVGVSAMKREVKR